MSTRPNPSAAAVFISDWWTPEQALAVSELLDELRDALWAIHGDRIQDLLQQEQGFAAPDLQSDEPTNDDSSF
jgi:hypothetical protein